MPVSRLCAEIDGRVGAFLSRPIEGEWPYHWRDATYVKVREAETFWTEFLRSLARRGLCGVKLVVPDAHEGLKAAIARVLHATWQRGGVHFTRSRARASAASPPAMVADQPRTRVPRLAALMDSAEEDVLAHMAFPREHRAKLHSTPRPRSGRSA